MTGLKGREFTETEFHQRDVIARHFLRHRLRVLRRLRPYLALLGWV